MYTEEEENNFGKPCHVTWELCWYFGISPHLGLMHISVFLD